VLFAWVTDQFAVGRYYYTHGAKLLVYRDPLERYDYVVPFEAVQEWHSRIHTEYDYAEFAKRVGKPFDRTTGLPVKSSGVEEFRAGLNAWAQDFAAQQGAAVEDLLVNLDPATPLWTLLAGEVASPQTGSAFGHTATTAEYVVAGVDLVALVVPASIEARAATRAGAAATTRGFPVLAPVSATRARVMANISEVQAATASSNIEVLFAKEAQLRAGYGMDAWSMTTLPKGSILYGGIPGQSAFYTDAATVVGSGGSRAALFQSLQAAPNPLLGYRPAVSMYEVLQDIRVPAGTALGNPGLGVGGSNQFFIWNYANQLREVPYIPLGR